MIELKISKKIYSKKTLMHAIEMYSKLTYIESEENENYWTLHFFKCKFDENLTVSEFENYLIGLENEKR